MRNPALYPRVLLHPLTALLVLLLAACSSSSDPAQVALRTTQPAPGKARVVLFYPAPITGTNGMIQVKWRDGDTETCDLDAGTFVVREVLPGKHKIAFSFCGVRGPSFFKLTAEAGHIYYLQLLPYDSSFRGIASGYPSEFDDNGKPLALGPIQIQRIEEPAALEMLKSYTQAVQPKS